MNILLQKDLMLFSVHFGVKFSPKWQNEPKYWTHVALHFAFLFLPTARNLIGILFWPLQNQLYIKRKWNFNGILCLNWKNGAFDKKIQMVLFYWAKGTNRLQLLLNLIRIKDYCKFIADKGKFSFCTKRYLMMLRLELELFLFPFK